MAHMHASRPMRTYGAWVRLPDGGTECFPLFAAPSRAMAIGIVMRGQPAGARIERLVATTDMTADERGYYGLSTRY